jgi:hypothetical protein
MARKGHPSPARMMFAQLDEIDGLTAISPAKAEEILKIAFDPVPSLSNEHLYLFQGQGRLWRQAELRLPPGGDGRRFVLVLEPAAPLSMNEVMAHFGDVYAVEAPNPSAGAQAKVGYSYMRATGNLRFAFRSFEEFSAEVILFDCM